MAEPIKMLFGLWTLVGTWNYVLNEGLDLHMHEGNFERERSGPL